MSYVKHQKSCDMTQNKSWFRNILCCPDCMGPLKFWQDKVSCEECGFHSEKSGNQLNLLPKQPRSYPVEFERGVSHQHNMENLDIDSPTQIYNGPRAQRDSSELISALQCYVRNGNNALDLGCGPRDQAVVFESLQCNYVGMDYNSQKADVRGDAHCMPFLSNSFDVVFSYAVLEHLHNPFVAGREISRVLKTNGVFCGTVSQGEPFHDSYFHHTAWGLASVATQSGLLITRLWPSVDTIHALSHMGRYASPIRLGLRALDTIQEKLPVLAPRKTLLWSCKEKQWDKIFRAGSLCFLMTKPREASETLKKD